MNKPAKIAAYGSLYLDEGENFQFAKKQIDEVTERATKHNSFIIGWFFDVLGWEEQRVQGRAIAKKVEQYIKKTYPFVKAVNVDFSSNEDTGEKPRKDAFHMSKNHG